jgi:hypothetical protein
MLRLAATYADLWNAEGPAQQPEEIRPRQIAGDAACTAVGRDPATLGRSASVVVKLPMGQGEPSADGQPEKIAQMLRNYAREGLSHVQLWLVPNTLAALEWFTSVLTLLDHDEA